MEIEAIKIGLNLHYFWTLTPKQFEKYIKAYSDKEKNRVVENDMLNHILGKYMAIAFNDPKHYPLKSFLSKTNELVEMTDEEMEKQAVRNTIRMGGVINK